MSDKKVVVNGSLIPSVKNVPLDYRTRVATIEDIANIEVPFIGMIVYVEQEGKFYVIKTLKSKQVGPVEVENSVVDEFEELIDPNFATEDFVRNAIAEAQLSGGDDNVDLSGFATKDELNAKVDKEEGKSLVADSEIARLAELKNYDDADIKAQLDNKADKADIPSVEGLASEDFVRNAIAEAELNAGDKEVDLSGFATKDELSLKADKSEIPSLEGLATEQFVQDEIAKIEIPEVPEVSFEGYATEEFVQQEIAKIEIPEVPEVDLEPYAKKEDLANLASKDDIKEMATKSDVINKVDAVPGKSLVADTEIERLAGVFNANYQFKINMIAAGEEASVSMEGTYPNIIVTFNIPAGVVEDGGGEEPEEPPVEQPVPRMWYGIIPFDASGVAGVNNPDQINENMTYEAIQFGLNGGKLTETDPAPIGKIPVSLVKEDEGGFLCVIYPTDSNLIAYMDNGIGGKIPFTEMDKVSGLAKDACAITQPINDVQYTMDIMMITVAAATTMYIEEK